MTVFLNIVYVMSLAALAIGYFELKGKSEEGKEADRSIKAFINRIESLMSSIEKFQQTGANSLAEGAKSLNGIWRAVNSIAEKLPENQEKRANQATLDAVRELVSRS
jgi:hypothetical protein